MVSGTADVLTVRSNPSGATVSADGIPRGVTPTQFGLSRTQDHMVAIDLQGYKRYEMPIKRGVNGWFFGNIFIGGATGMLIDGLDGAIYALDPDTINANLEPVGTRRRGAGSTMADDPGIGLSGRPGKAGWKKIGQLERL